MKSAPAEGLTSIKPPKLKKGEILVGGFIAPDGQASWTILLPGDKNNVNWQDALAWAKKQGGDLPSRPEQVLLFAQHKDKFEQRAYWSNTQPAGAAGSAWFQFFVWGNQINYGVSAKLRARAVRRVPI